MGFHISEVFGPLRSDNGSGVTTAFTGKAPAPIESRGTIRLAVACLAVPALLLAADPTGHPLVHPYEGSKLAGSKFVEFDEYDIPKAKVEKSQANIQHLEGKITTLSYRNPPGRAAIEIYRNYESAFQAAGFQTVFTCRGQACGGWMQLKWLGGYPKADDGYYAAFKLARAGGDVWVGMGISPGAAELAIVEPKAMDTGKVVIDAAALQSGIASQGHIAVYGIHFATGKAELQPESEAVLAEIASLLQKDAALKLHVIGHTDNQGALASNMDLSKRRAAAVVAALTKSHGVSPARLLADGVGPLSPVATNRSDEGRALNRRVELVEQ